jgi:fucose permease
MTIGFAAMVCTCVAVAWAPQSLLAPVFLLLGISVGVPMSAVTLFVGRKFPERCAAHLTFLNFSWSIGALAAPLIAARILVHHSYPTAYILFAIASAAASVACGAVLRDDPEPMSESNATATITTASYLVAIFAFSAFLQVGIENTVAAWLPSYALRTAGSGIVLAAASSSLYWAGFLLSRGVTSLLLLRTAPMQIFRVCLALGFASALLLMFSPSVAGRSVAMFLLGAALAPTYPLVLAGFFARTRRTADTRWILFTAGFGGSFVPWVAGYISAHTGSLRTGMLIIPSAMVLMAFVMPGLRKSEKAAAHL